jgi:eukaryotic-like serine/threonine-protein kinase
MSLPSNDGDVIEYLVAHGAYVEAARICVERGDLPRAIQLYERVWRFADALPLAEQLGDPALAVRLALDAKLVPRATELAAMVGTGAPDTLRAVAEAFASRGRPFEGARVFERAAEHARAADLYRRAGALLDEARARAAAGQPREAGLLYERLVADGAPDEVVAARLALGRLLARLGRHKEAARLLQAAARTPAVATAALRALCGPLLALGLRVAAADVLARLRRDTPTLPTTPEELVALEDAELAIVGRAFDDRGAPRRFRVERLLGAGATGRVFLAHDTLLGQPVALKLLSVGAGSSTPERQAYLRYAREAEAAGRLRHPNIVALHDADPGAGLFVLELMAGGTLAERLAATGPLTLAHARRLGLDVLAALGVAHARGIVHRDVKPANVFFDAAGNAKLGDFGAAHLADFGQTQTGGFFGTVAYMAPEQITGSAIGVAADLYALGVTLFQALTGRPPFLGPDLVAQHLGEAPPLPSSLRAELTPAHDEVLSRALAKAPGDRFGSAAEMAAALAGWPADGAPRALDEVPSAPHAVAAPQLEPETLAVVDEAREVGRTPLGLLLLRREPRTARVVLVEQRAAPLDDAALVDMRRRAAAGGPYVQRVLHLSDDRREIWYEALEGDVWPAGAATAPEHARLVVALPDFHLPLTHFARTPAGPVWLVAPLPISS